MPSPERLTPCRIRLLYSHVTIAIADDLFLPILTGFNNKLLWAIRSSTRLITSHLILIDFTHYFFLAAIPPWPYLGFLTAIPPFIILGLDFCVAGTDAPQLAFFVFMGKFPINKWIRIFYFSSGFFKLEVFTVTSKY